MVVENYSEEKMVEFLFSCNQIGLTKSDIRELNHLIMFGEDNEISGPNRYYGVMGTKFVSISDIGIDFLAFIMCNGAYEYVKECISNGNIMSPGVVLPSSIAYFIYTELKKVVKLKGYEYCIYMQAVTHYRRFNKSFSVDEMLSWLPKDGSVCNMHHNKLTCKYRKDDCCTIKTEIDVYELMKDMEVKGFVKEKEKNVFCLKY